jgi:hypothetical protein
MNVTKYIHDSNGIPMDYEAKSVLYNVSNYDSVAIPDNINTIIIGKEKDKSKKLSHG